MISAKTDVLTMIQSLPDDCTSEDIRPTIFMCKKRFETHKAIEEGRVVSRRRGEEGGIMARIVWSEPAVKDLAENLRFLGSDSPEKVRRVGQRSLKSTRMLESSPFFGWELSDFEGSGAREFIVRPFRVIYEVRDEECHILAVIHGSRDLKSTLDSTDWSKRN